MTPLATSWIITGSILLALILAYIILTMYNVYTTSEKYITRARTACKVILIIAIVIFTLNCLFTPLWTAIEYKII